MTKQKNLITTQEAADVIGVSQRSVINYIATGKLEAEKSGGKYMIKRGEARRVQRERIAELKAIAKKAKEKEKDKAKKARKGAK